MTALNKSIREGVADKLLRRKYAEPLKTLDETHAVASQKFYETLYTKKQRSLMDELGAEFFQNVVQINIHNTCAARFAHAVPICAKGGWLNYSSLTAPQREAADTLAKIEAAIRKTKADHERTKGELLATMGAFRSIEALVKAWPEVEPFLPKNIFEAPMKAMIPIDLNERLGLPVKAGTVVAPSAPPPVLQTARRTRKRAAKKTVSVAQR